MDSFANIEFDPIEEDIPDHMTMYGKKFKILNQKINSLIQLQDDGGGKNSVSGIEMEVMLKVQERRIQDKLDLLNQSNELRVKAQSNTFNGTLRDLKDIEKAKHVLHVQDVKTVQGNLNFKI